MLVSQMYPKKHFDAVDLRDFCGEDVTAVTIEKADYRTEASNEIGEAKVSWFLYVEELKKPIKINARGAYQIAEILGAEDTSDWTGRTIGIRAGQFEAYGKWRWGVDFYAVGQRKPTLPPKTDLTGYAAWSEAQKARLSAKALPPAKPQNLEPLGAQKAAAIIVGLRERGLSWADLERACRQADCAALIDGMLPPDCPTALADRARVLCATTPVVTKATDRDGEIAALVASWAPPPGTAEVVDPVTGEVIPTDDIPF